VLARVPALTLDGQGEIRIKAPRSSAICGFCRQLCEPREGGGAAGFHEEGSGRSVSREKAAEQLAFIENRKEKRHET